MNQMVNDFVLNIGTVNGSGSQSANTIILKSLFRMGIPVGGKNVFPSNIQGLPTWFWVRASSKGYTGRRKDADIVVAMNPQTLVEDHKVVKSGGVFIYNTDLKVENLKLRDDVTNYGVPFKTLVDQATTVAKIKKLLTNIVYVGVLAELLEIDDEVLQATLVDQFDGKESVVEPNRKAMGLGRQYVQENFKKSEFPIKVQKMDKTSQKMMIDGNTAGALGLVFGGASFAAWYPITPSSSLVENFMKYSAQLRKTEDGKNKFAVVQAEDEISSICMVLGAGWAGARSFTATSGPGLSLMQEAAGFAYYAEIPSVIWDVQRVGPSTGMPTRTAQGDIMLALHSSHGDTKHPVLLPGSPKECFEFGQAALDLADRLQTLVHVLSDLDIGMNLWMEDDFQYPDKPMDRGKILTEDQINQLNAQGKHYYRYMEVDGDGIPYRTLPGTRHAQAPYLTRGSGHGPKAQYTEKSDEYQDVVDRLVRKWETARTLVPKPEIIGQGKKIGVISYGSASAVMKESIDLLSAQKIEIDVLRIRSIPFNDDVKNFIHNHDRVYVFDLNRDGQMYDLIRLDYPDQWQKLKSIRHYDGTPVTAESIVEPVLRTEKGL
ncbi:MAG: pyruvate ferredoxin oxidoreductase [Oligoflexia bacterium]|nr:MAG: pyruvate ferredoxin oxidoreductase [Oligoflexia bacterium]